MSRELVCWWLLPSIGRVRHYLCRPSISVRCDVHLRLLPSIWRLQSSVRVTHGATVHLSATHTEKTFWNLVNSNRNQIVFTIFRLIWNQKDVCLVLNHLKNGKYNLISVRINRIPKRFLCVQWNLFLDPSKFIGLWSYSDGFSFVLWNPMEFRWIHNQKADRHYDHIYFNSKWFRNTIPWDWHRRAGGRCCNFVHKPPEK